MTKAEWLNYYIDEMERAVDIFREFNDYNQIYSVIRKGISVLGVEAGLSITDFSLKSVSAIEDSEIFIEKLKYKLDKIQSSTNNTDSSNGKTVIFLSHKSDDKKYGDALRNFIIGLGIKDNQLIYTSHPMHKIPLDVSIYDYLRSNLNSNVFMIILWSDKYLESPACLNEMGAVWVAQTDYTNIYVPDFSFGNPKYHECAVDTRKMGAVLNGDLHCKMAMIELKKKIESMFDLNVDEGKLTYLLDNFMKEIS